MRTIVITLALLAAVAAVCTAAWSASFQPTRTDMTDVVVGLDKTGPYALTWSGIAPASERVEINNVPLVRGVDYTVDWAQGTITFGRPLRANVAANVSYLRQPGESKANLQPVDLPVAIALGGIGDTNLALALRYQQQSADGARGVYGLRAGHNGATKIDAAMFFSTLTGDARPAAGDAGRGYGWRIGAQRSFSKLDLAAALTRADKGFSAPADLATPAGQQTLSLSAAYRPSTWLTAKVATTTADSVADTAAAATRTNEYALSAKPLAGTDVSVSRTEVESQLAATATTQTTDKVQATMALGSTTASAGYQRSLAGSVQTDAQYLRVASSLGGAIKLAASQASTRSDTGYQRASDLALDLGATKRARLRAVVGTRHDAVNDDYRGVAATLQPLQAFTLDAAYKQHDFGDTSLDTKRAALLLSPMRGFEIGGEYSLNPEDEKGQVRQAKSTKARVATQLGVLGLAGSLARETAVAGPEQRAGEVRLTLALASAHKLYTAYKQIETVGIGAAAGDETEVYLLGYEHAVGSDFSLALEGQVERARDYQQLRSDTQRADAKLNWRF